MATIKTTVKYQVKGKRGQRYLDLDNPIVTQRIYVGNGVGKGVTQFTVTNENPTWLYQFMNATPEAQRQMAFNRSKAGKARVLAKQKQNLFDVMSDYFGLTNAQQRELADVAEQLTSDQFDTWYKENKYIVRDMFNYYMRRKHVIGEGGSEVLRDYYFEGIIESLRKRFGIVKTNRSEEFW